MISIRFENSETIYKYNTFNDVLKLENYDEIIVCEKKLIYYLLFFSCHTLNINKNNYEFTNWS